MNEAEETNARAVAGNNLPEFDPKTVVDLDILADQLRVQYAHLFKEQITYVESANRWLSEHPNGVENDEAEAALTERLAGLLAVCDAYWGKPASAHTIAKEPFLKGGRIVDAILNKELAGPIVTVSDNLKQKLKAYKDAKVKRLREEQAANAQRAADAAAAAAAQAQARGTEVDLDAALAAEQASIDAVADAENSKVGSLSQSRGDLGALSGLRGKWKARVVDESKIPRSCMSPNMPIIEVMMNQSKDKKTGAPTVVIPGVEFYQETSLSIRR